MYDVPNLDTFSHKSPKFRQPCQCRLNLGDMVKCELICKQVSRYAKEYTNILWPKFRSPEIQKW